MHQPHIKQLTCLDRGASAGALLYVWSTELILKLRVFLPSTLANRFLGHALEAAAKVRCPCGMFYVSSLGAMYHSRH